MRKNILLLLVSLLLCVFLIELFLNIFNPFHFRIKGNKIILPSNQIYRFINPNLIQLDRKIVHSKNSLGFRGSEIPTDFNQFLSIITVGGSTTECYYINDKNTWPEKLSQMLEKRYRDVWVNNVGLDGHSTYGHIILLEDYLIKIKPKIIIFLIGLNDIGNNNMRDNDYAVLKEAKYKGIIGFLRRSEIINMLVNFKRLHDVVRLGVHHGGLDVRNPIFVENNDVFMKQEINKHRALYISEFRERVEKLILICKTYGIIPILMTQPSLLGKGNDPVTGVDLERIQASDLLNGKMFWNILELYNAVTREVGKEQGILVIDLAKFLPKTSEYYYDGSHFTNQGCEVIGKIIFESLINFLDKEFKNYLRTS